MNRNFLFVIAASLLFGIIPSIQDHVLLSGVTPIALVILCNGVSCLIGLIYSILTHTSLRINRRNLLDIAGVGVIGLFLTDYLLDIAYTMIPVGFVTMIHFLYPSVVCIVMALRFHEKMNLRKVFAMLCSATGLILLAGGSFSGNLFGVLVASSTAAAYAFYMIKSDKSSVALMPLSTRVFYTNLFVTLAASLVAFILSFQADIVFPQSSTDWLLGCVAGSMLCAATFLINAGIIKLGAGTASFINMVEPITSLIVSAIVYRYVITPSSFLGCFFILGALAFIARNSQNKKNPSPVNLC